MERGQGDAPPSIHDRVRFGQAGGHGVEPLFCFLHRRARGESADAIHEPPRPGFRSIGVDVREVPGDPRLDALVGKREVGRHHADDLISVSARDDRPAQDVGVAPEESLPDSVAEHDGPVPDDFAGEEVPAEHRLHTQHTEEIDRHLGRADLLQPEVGAVRPRRQIPRGHGLEACRRTRPVRKIERRRTVQLVVYIRVRLPDTDELLCVGVRQGLEEDAAHDAEQRDVRRDPDTQRRHDHRAEPRGSCQAAERTPQCHGPIGPTGLAAFRKALQQAVDEYVRHRLEPDPHDPQRAAARAGLAAAVAEELDGVPTVGVSKAGRVGAEQESIHTLRRGASPIAHEAPSDGSVILASAAATNVRIRIASAASTRRPKEVTR